LEQTNHAHLYSEHTLSEHSAYIVASGLELPYFKLSKLSSIEVLHNIIFDNL
jgi:hypothetical protein